MPARHSPAVRYPLAAAPKLWPWGVVFLALLIVWWFVWLMHGAGFGADRWSRGTFSALLLAVCVYVVWQAWKQWPQGHLHWNGMGWTWEYALRSVTLQAAPVVLVDLQWLLVLVWQSPQQEGVQRFVLLQHSARHGWADLRRAVYSPVHPISTDVAAKTE